MAIISPQRREHINRWGIWRSLYEFLMMRLQRHCSLVFCVVITRPLRTSVPPLAENIGREYRFLSEPELIKFAKNQELQLNPSIAKAAFKKGDTCIGAINNGRLIPIYGALTLLLNIPTTCGLILDQKPAIRMIALLCRITEASVYSPPCHCQQMLWINAAGKNLLLL